MAETRERRPLVRGRLRLRSNCAEARGDVIVRVPLGMYGRTYAYVVRGPVAVGDVVEVHGRVSGWTRATVYGFGRRGYAGPLKRGRVIR